MKQTDREPSDLSPAELLALVESARAQTAAALEPDARLIYGVWGGAWLLGFAGLYSAHARVLVELPVVVAGLAFAGLLLAAMAVTGVHIARRVAGIRGVSSRVGAMYGWAWPLGFVTGSAVVVGLSRAGVEEPVLRLASTTGSGLLVGLLYLAAGALWQDWVQYGLGLWILATTAAGALAGDPGVYLVMSLAGGGGFLLAAAFFSFRGSAAPGRSAPTV